MPEELEDLELFVGQWRMTPSFATNASGAPHALTTFEWLAGKRFLIQRWEVEHPDAPDGIAIIGFDMAKTAYLQHYFDSRGSPACTRWDWPTMSGRFSGSPSTPTSHSVSSGTFVRVAVRSSEAGRVRTTRVQAGLRISISPTARWHSSAGADLPWGQRGPRAAADRRIRTTERPPPAGVPGACPGEESNLDHSSRKRVLHPLTWAADPAIPRDARGRPQPGSMTAASTRSLIGIPI